MLTLFTTAKPFQGHNGIIQRNALRSWKMLHADIEVLLFGDEGGAAEACAEIGVRHEPVVERNEFGTVLVSSMFAQAQAVARHDVLSFVNCDIILMQDFCRAVSQIKGALSRFVMVGRRWDTGITEPIDFASATWEQQIRERAVNANRQRDPWWIDYFACSRGVFGPDVPRFAIGRTSWDNWLAWKGCESGCLVDASPSIMAVHQNHDYAHHALGTKGVWTGAEARHNFELSGGWDHLRSIADATFVLKNGKIKSNPKRHWRTVRGWITGAPSFVRYRLFNPVWFAFLGITRPVRHALGLRSKGVQ